MKEEEPDKKQEELTRKAPQAILETMGKDPGSLLKDAEMITITILKDLHDELKPKKKVKEKVEVEEEEEVEETSAEKSPKEKKGDDVDDRPPWLKKKEKVEVEEEEEED